MIIRHLVLPNHLECCTKPVLEMIASKLPKDRILMNVMDQYTPMHRVLLHPDNWPDIARFPSEKEIQEARELASVLRILWEPVS